MLGDEFVDVAWQGKGVARRGDSFPGGMDQERADAAPPAACGIGPSFKASEGPSSFPHASAGSGQQARSRRNYSRPVAELLLRRYAVSPALERLREAACCEDRQDLARWFRAGVWDIDEAESRGVIPADWLLDIFLIKGVNPNWILTGRGSRYLCPASGAGALADGDLVEACLAARQS